jgi:hypothetical protein
MALYKGPTLDPLHAIVFGGGGGSVVGHDGLFGLRIGATREGEELFALW